jgi:hypothetical protein
VSTALLLVAVVVAGVFTARLYGIEKKWDAEREFEACAGEASMVTAWVGWRGGDRAGKRPAGDCLITRNTSGLPVYRAALMIRMVASDGSYVGAGEVDLPTWEPDEEVHSLPVAMMSEQFDVFSASGSHALRRRLNPHRHRRFETSSL